MPTLDDQLRPMSRAEQRRANAPHERAALLATEHRLGMVRLTDALLADEDPLTCAELAQRFPELHLQARGTLLPPRYRLPEMTAEREAQLRATPLMLGEDGAVAAAIRRCRIAAEEADRPDNPSGTSVQLGDDAGGLQEALARARRAAGVGQGGAA